MGGYGFGKGVREEMDKHKGLGNELWEGMGEGGGEIMGWKGKT